jgi:hypothetical protein
LFRLFTTKGTYGAIVGEVSPNEKRLDGSLQSEQYALLKRNFPAAPSFRSFLLGDTASTVAMKFVASRMPSLFSVAYRQQRTLLQTNNVVDLLTPLYPCRLL